MSYTDFSVSENANAAAARPRCRLHDIALGADGRCVLCKRKREDVPEQQGSPWRMLAFLSLLTLIALGGYVLSRQDETPPALSEEELEPWRAPKPTPPERAARPQPPPQPTGESRLIDLREEVREEMAERQRRIDLEMKRVPITIYCTTSDKACVAARKWFDENGYTYVDRDIEADGRFLRERDRLNPSETVPTLKIGDTVLTAFDDKTIERTIRQIATQRVD